MPDGKIKPQLELVHDLLVDNAQADRPMIGSIAADDVQFANIVRKCLALAHCHGQFPDDDPPLDGSELYQRDLLYGEDGPAVMSGDNARIDRPTTPVGDGPVVRLATLRTATSPSTMSSDRGRPHRRRGPPPGEVIITGNGGNDLLYGQGGNDVVEAGIGDDVAEGNHGTDTVRGGAGADDLVGGGSSSGDDVIGGSSPGTAATSSPVARVRTTSRAEARPGSA